MAGLKPGLQLRISQHLALTPQLQQSIRLLQLSTLELQQEVERVLLENPLLECDDDPLASHLRLGADGAVLAGSSAPSPSEGESPAREEGAGPLEGEASAPGDWDDDDPWVEAPAGSRPVDEDAGEGPRDWAAAQAGLHDFLRAQLATTRVSDRDHALVALLIEDLDERGFLRTPLEELGELCGAEAGVEIEELATALRLLQSFDPPGVGARSVSECLCLQIDQRLARIEREAGRSGATASSAADAAANAAADAAANSAASAALEAEEFRLARRIVAEHLQLLAERDYARLQRHLGVDEDGLRRARARILSLNPIPGAAFAGPAPAYVVPDIEVRLRSGRWVAVLNREVMPRLRINRGYAAILRREARRRVPAGGEAAAPAEGGWAGQLQEANWFLRNLRQRFETILRVAQAIVDRQSRFFSHGAIAMRPLVLREIAETLDLHESTVSRVTANKFMATPFGVFELRYFFGSHVATDSGGEASSTAIRELIRQLIAAEDARRPLPDGKIAELLAAQGMVVARRTVAKYREQLQIPPVSLRRNL